MWMDDDAPPTGVQQAVAGRWRIHHASPEEALSNGVVFPPVVMLRNGDRAGDYIRAVTRRGCVPVVWGGRPADVDGAGLLEVAEEVSAEELRLVLTTAMALAPTVRQLLAELEDAKASARLAARTADDLDEEMRLASKLQQDFLPRRLPTVDPLRFGALYKPASWVSGDIYDVSRLDETHVGFYIADAVGHGMPAALMTMFIKEAMETKRILGRRYELIPPHEVLAALNNDLCRQMLSMCEFCTALYGIVDVQSLTLHISRAGHPAPVLIHEDGSMEELALPGSLLGILPDAEFQTRDIPLRPGDRLVLYSDGTEETLCGKGKTRHCEFSAVLEQFKTLSREDWLTRMAEQIEIAGQEDDVTLLLAEVQSRIL